MTDLVHVPAETPARPQWIELMRPAAELASQIVGTDFVPEAYRRNAAAIAACVMFGAEIGVPPMQSLAKIDLVKGRPAPRAELARALALAAGHELWVEEATNTKVTVAGHRRGSNHIQTVTWTMDDAKKAGLAGNTNYAKYPRQMLIARASADLVRQMCPDVLGGITVFAEEAGDIEPNGDTPGTVTFTAATPVSYTATTGKQTRRRTPKAAPEPIEQPPLPDDQPPAAEELINEAQLKKLVVTMREVGIEDRDDKLAAIAALIGHTVESSKELTKDEASTVIDGLEGVRIGNLAFDIDNDGTWTVTEQHDERFDQPELPDDF